MARKSWSDYRSNTEKEFKLSGKIRDFNRVTKLYEKGRLYLSGNPVTQPLFEDLRTAIRIISEIYENQWDISFKAFQEVKTNKRGVGHHTLCFDIDGILILFESLTIRNTSGGTIERRGHLIKDLLVKIPLSTNNGRRATIGRIQGTRLTVTYAEWQSHYFHSHLDTTNDNIRSAGPRGFPLFKSFCTGSGEINIYEQNINGDGLNEARFTQYAMQIMALVSHESIEGHPYRRFQNISARPASGRTYSTPNNTTMESFYRTVIQFYKTNPTIKPVINIAFDTQGMYTVSEDEVYTEFITKPFTIQQSMDFYRRYWCIVGDRGIYYQYNEAPRYAAVPDLSNYKTIFRGQERTFTVESAGETNTPLTNVIHPNFVKHFKTKLEYELNKKRITESTVNRYKDQDNNARESLEANPISV